jgi:hypothetical protein
MREKEKWKWNEKNKKRRGGMKNNYAIVDNKD